MSTTTVSATARARAAALADEVATAAAEDLARIRDAERVHGEPPLAGDAPLVDPHAHFWHPDTPRADWRAVNAARLRAGERIGVTWHVASILGSWGAASPTYFASPTDVTVGNTVMLALQRALPDRVRAWVHVNPNFPAHAADEIQRARAEGAIGIKLSASRRADDLRVLAPVCALAAALDLPILHHVWQWRRRDWPMQEASDGVELATLARAHPDVRFLLAHIGGGGEWAHTHHAVRDVPNVCVDTSGSGIDRGMLDDALAAVGQRRVLWAADLTLCTGLTKLRALEVIGLDAEAMADVRWRNAARLYPAGALPGLPPA